MSLSCFLLAANLYSLRRHFSVTGRFERLKEVAFEYAFLLKAMCLPDSPLKEEASS